MKGEGYGTRAERREWNGLREEKERKREEPREKPRKTRGGGDLIRSSNDPGAVLPSLSR